MKAVVTGVAGFIGSQLAERLIAEGHEVIGVDLFVPYYPRHFKERNLLALRDSKRFTFIEGDLNLIPLGPLLEGVDWVFHQAAQAGVRASWEAFPSYVAHNVTATQRLLRALEGHPTLKKLVYASSSSVYGNAERYPTAETVLPAPVSPYGVTKLAAEHLMVLYHSQFRVPTVSLRYFTVYGPRQRPDMAFRIFAEAALRRQPIAVFGDGQQTRDFTFVDDIVTANILAAERGLPGAVYNIGGGHQISLVDAIKILEEHTGPITLDRKPAKAGDARHTGSDTTRARAELGYAPRIDLREGLRREVAFVEELLRML